MIPLVLIPGMMCDARLYQPQISAFSHRVPIHTVPVSTHSNMQDLAKDILDNAPPVFALAGLSMGGIIAMEVLRQAPNRIAKLALLDTNPRAEVEEIKKNRQLLMANVQQNGLAEVIANTIPKYFSPTESLATQKNLEIIELCNAMSQSSGVAAYINQSLALRDRQDQQETLKKLAANVPTLILCGEDDQLCPVERHTLMKSLMPHADLHIIKGAGHLPTLQAPEQTNRALESWLFT
ncbi:alpha/beta fold hydrolase [Psychrobacter sp. NG27]|uniref:alpha/beta fold hydrolase n=1 Tax=Psychrobacter sp. NG27 TaxID=2781966 RepID=UPI0018DF508A|nr:alpha/beta fold hydrolase [Psychrobacter sp. NG27]MBI0426185.1 alpha/beta fold hydrolase [Psychrobacter sp. NG27]